MYQNSDLYEKGKKIFRQTVVLIGAGALKIRKTTCCVYRIGRWTTIWPTILLVFIWYQI